MRNWLKDEETKFKKGMPIWANKVSSYRKGTLH